jgi:hypothetical protein
MDDNRFPLAVLLAAAGASFVVGLHELDALLTLAAPLVVLLFLTLTAAALGAALLAALGGMRRTMRASLGVLLLAYGLLLAAAWYRFMTDPTMFQDTQPEESVRLRSIRF